MLTSHECPRFPYLLRLHAFTRPAAHSFAGARLPDSFWIPNRYGVMGGVEFGFSSMTLDRSQAEHYASEGQASTIFEMQMGMGAQRCCQVRTHHHTRTEYLPIFLEAAGIVSLGRPYTCVCC
jgi:hypothetical protein